MDHSDEDQDSLFGSPPPSPARGRSPSTQTSVPGESSFLAAIPTTGMVRKNVGTIALPGSHMSCAELPANLSATGSSLSHHTSSHHSQSVVAPNISGTPALVHTPVITSRSSTRSVASRASAASAPTRKRRTPKAKSPTSASPAPPIPLPDPNEPTPPNFLRSQSALLGLAGLVGSVKPAQLHSHGSHPSAIQSPREQSPLRGSTPAHPIVLDDDQDTSHIEKQSRGQFQVSQPMDQLDPDVLRSNIMNSLTREKNIFPVLESLIKLFGGEPLLPPTNSSPQPFARPYGHGIFRAQSPASAATPSPSGTSSTPAAPSTKRRKLKHVPAGAADWDVPFPFAAGEGPTAYRDTWAQDRAKQLVTQLLELVQNATKRAAIKTARTGGKASKGRTGVPKRQSSRSVSVETQVGQTASTQFNTGEVHTGSTLDAAATETSTSMDIVGDLPAPLDTPNTNTLPDSDPKKGVSVNSDVAVRQGGSEVCDYSAFEEWLSQLQQFVPPESTPAVPDPDWDAQVSQFLESTSTPALNIPASAQFNAVTIPLTTRDEAIDPALLAISQSQSPILPTSPDDMLPASDLSFFPPVLLHSPRTSLSSLTEPLTPPSEAFSDVPMSTIVHQDLDHGCPPVEKGHCAGLPDRESSLSLTEFSETSAVNAAQKGKTRADDGTPSVSARSTPSASCLLKGTLDKRAILERARERRAQLVAEIERAKLEIWETSIENAVLVHLSRDGSL